jgi:hypothetical protein
MFEPLFWLIGGIFAVVEGDFIMGVRTGALTVEPGLSRMFTLSVPVCPKLSVTVSRNRRSVSAETIGAVNSHTGVFTPLKVILALVGI